MRFKENSRLGSVLITQIIGECSEIDNDDDHDNDTGGEETCIGEYSGVTR